MMAVARVRALFRVAALGALPAMLYVAPGRAQDSASAKPIVYPVNASAAPAPFGPGERLIYKVKIGIFNAGEGEMTVEGLDTIRGHLTYHAIMKIRGGFLAAKVNDLYQTWMDVGSLMSWRFVQDIHEVNYESYRDYEMYPGIQMWERADNDESGPLGSLLPLDDISFLYYLRTIPMEVGKQYTFNRYFKEDGNPVVVNVVRRERRKEDAGTFETVVVKPTIKTKGLFSEGGKAELYFTDDERRILVYMKSDIPHFPGSLTLHLKSIEEGLPLNPASRASALSRQAAPDTTRSR
jgi:hypothetical protein